MLRGSFRLIAPGLTLAAVATLSGCSSDDKPRTLPPVSQTPVSAPVTATQSSLTTASAEAFVRDVFVSLNSALRTGDTKAYRAALSPHCSCSGLADAIDEAYRNGRYDGAAYVVDELKADTLAGKVAAVRVVFHNPAARRLDRSGRVTATLAPVASRTAVYSVGFEDGQWQVLTVRYLAS